MRRYYWHFYLFVHSAKYSNTLDRIALFGIRIYSGYLRYSVFGIFADPEYIWYLVKIKYSAQHWLAYRSRHQAVGIQLSASSSWHPAVGILQLTSSCLHQAVGIHLSASSSWHPEVGILQLASSTWHQEVCKQSSSSFKAVFKQSASSALHQSVFMQSLCSFMQTSSSLHLALISSLHQEVFM